MKDDTTLTGLPLFAAIQAEEGLRVPELVRLEWSDVDMEGRSLRLPAVNLRSYRWRRVSSRTHALLGAALAVVPPSPFVFPSPRTGNPYATEAVFRWFQRHGISAATNRREWVRRAREEWRLPCALVVEMMGWERP